MTEEQKKKISESHKKENLSEVTLQKMSEARKGKKLSEEIKKKISKSNEGKGNPFYGRKHSKKSKERMSKSHKGKIMSEEVKKKMSKDRKGKMPWNKGIPCSEEQKEKISISNKGHKAWNKGVPCSDETKRKISNSHKKENLSDESRKNISEAKKGKIASKKSKIEMSKAKKGKNNPSWKGGISFLPYCEKFNNKFKKSIREKFNRECFICGITEEKNGKKLCIHHVNYDKDCLCNNLKCYFIPLCISCHTRTNFNREFWEKLLTTCCQDQEMSKYFTDENESPIKISVKSNIIAEIDNYL